MKEYRREKKKENKKRKAEALADGNEMDPEMAKIMGFGGFSSSKK